MNVKTINREASKASGRGLSFQRTRAVQRLLRLIKQNGSRVCYCATEFIEDSATLVPEDTGVDITIEENKNYSSGLSFNSDPIKNTIVAFADQYLAYFNDNKTIDFSIFCHAKISDEQLDNTYIQNHILGFIPQTAKKTRFKILNKLASNIDLDENEITLARNLFLDEYRKQYTVYKDTQKTVIDYIGGNYNKVVSWKNDDFLEFIKGITFIIDDADSDDLDESVKDDIRNCEFYNQRHYGLENIILSAIEILFDKSQQDERKFGRFVSRDKVQVVFLQIAANNDDYKPVDPSWESFAAIDTEDQRNLTKKYLSVCNSISTRHLTRLSLSATNSRANETIFGQEYASLRCKIFEWCDEYLEKTCTKSNFTIDELNSYLDEMVDLCYNNVQDLKKTYRIRINDRDNIKGIILSLFDDCYLAYDE